MTALVYDFTATNKHQLQQGATETLQFEFFDDAAGKIPSDLTNFMARMQIRDEHDSATFILERTTEGPGGDNIVLGGPAGTLVIHITAAVMAALPAPFKGVYDLELIDSGGSVERSVEGAVEITPEVTR